MTRRHKRLLIAIYLGIGAVLRFGLDVWMMYFKEDGPSPYFAFAAPLSGVEKIAIFILGWIVPIVVWPVIVLFVLIRR